MVASEIVVLLAVAQGLAGKYPPAGAAAQDALNLQGVVVEGGAPSRVSGHIDLEDAGDGLAFIRVPHRVYECCFAELDVLLPADVVAHRVASSVRDNRKSLPLRVLR